jgi:hypothetical protein
MAREMKPSVWDFFFVRKRIISGVKIVNFVNDVISFIVLRGHWCDIIVLNVHAPAKGKSDDLEDSVCTVRSGIHRDKFPKYHSSNSKKIYFISFSWNFLFFIIIFLTKGKVHPRTGPEGPEGE